MHTCHGFQLKKHVNDHHLSCDEENRFPDHFKVNNRNQSDQKKDQVTLILS